MANTYSVLAQTTPSATTLTDSYTCNSALGAIVSSLMVCNENAVSITFRISVAVAGAADATKQYIYYDVTVLGNSTFAATLGLTLSNTDVIRVYASSTLVAFSFYGTKVS